MVEGVTVDVYGSTMKLRDIYRNHYKIQNHPDTGLGQAVAPIEKALIDAKLGINPVVTSELIRLPIPELSGGA